MALEHSTTNGPWLLEENFHKTNALLRYSHETAGGRFAVTAQGYDGEWRSTDQIPQRAVQSRRTRPLRFRRSDRRRRVASLQPRGRLVRADRCRAACTRRPTRSTIGSICSRISPTRLDTENGDQFEQFDDRRVYGGAARLGAAVGADGPARTSWTSASRCGATISAPSACTRLSRAQRIDTTREDDVTQSSYSAYSSLKTHWSEHVRTAVGLRADCSISTCAAASRRTPAAPTIRS